MDTDTIRIWKSLAEVYFNNNVAVYLKDALDSYYFGHIVAKPDERKIVLKCFAPPQRVDQVIELFWEEIAELRRYDARRTR